MWNEIKYNKPKEGSFIIVKGYISYEKDIKTQPAGKVYYSLEHNELCIDLDITFGGYFWMKLSEFKYWKSEQLFKFYTKLWLVAYRGRKKSVLNSAINHNECSYDLKGIKIAIYQIRLKLLIRINKVLTN